MNFSKILSKQNKHKKKTGKYFQVIKGCKKNPKEKEDIDFSDIAEDIEIHEHLCPNGEVGFTIIESKTENGKEYKKATGSGCGSSAHDWLEIIKGI